MLRTIYLFLIVLSANLGMASAANSQITVTLDPGEVGTSFYKQSFNFDNLNGMSPGTFDLDFALADSKFITVHLNGDWVFYVNLSITYSADTTGFVPVANGYLTDGVDKLYSKDSDSAGGGATDTYNIKWINWNDPAIDGFTFTNISSFVRSRVYPAGTTVVSAEVTIQVWGDAKTGTLDIGPVPEQDSGYLVVPLSKGGAAVIGL